MKYENKKNFRVAMVVETDDKAKTTMLQYEDDNTTTVVSNSTLKRWWKLLKDDEPTITEQEEEVNTQETTEPAVDTDEEMAGDGTPLAKVGKEIAEQAKEKSKKERTKKERRAKTPQFDSGDMKKYLEEYMESKGCTIVIRHKKDGSEMNKVVFKIDGHMVATLTFSRSNISVNVRPDVFETEPTKKVDSLFGARYVFNEDTTENRELSVNILDAAYNNQVERNTTKTTKTKKTKKEEE